MRRDPVEGGDVALGDLRRGRIEALSAEDPTVGQDPAEDLEEPVVGAQGTTAPEVAELVETQLVSHEGLKQVPLLLETGTRRRTILHQEAGQEVHGLDVLALLGRREGLHVDRGGVECDVPADRRATGVPHDRLDSRVGDTIRHPRHPLCLLEVGGAVREGERRDVVVGEPLCADGRQAAIEPLDLKADAGIRSQGQIEGVEVEPDLTPQVLRLRQRQSVPRPLVQADETIAGHDAVRVAAGGEKEHEPRHPAVGDPREDDVTPGRGLAHGPPGGGLIPRAGRRGVDRGVEARERELLPCDHPLSLLGEREARLVGRHERGCDGARARNVHLAHDDDVVGLGHRHCAEKLRLRVPTPLHDRGDADDVLDVESDVDGAAREGGQVENLVPDLPVGQAVPVGLVLEDVDRVASIDVRLDSDLEGARVRDQSSAAKDPGRCDAGELLVQPLGDVLLPEPDLDVVGASCAE